MAAISAVWFFATRTGIVVAISSKEDQLEKALWNEIELLLRSATWHGQPVDFGFACKHLEIRHRLENGRSLPKSYMIGRCVSQDENLAGVHLATLDGGTPTVLFICEEASGIDDKLWPVIRTSAHRMLVIGNPIRLDGEFHRMCSAGPEARHAQPGKLYRDVITISGEDSPNVRIGMACAKEGLPQPERPPVPGVGSVMVVRIAAHLARGQAVGQRKLLVGPAARRTSGAAGRDNIAIAQTAIPRTTLR